MSKCDAEIWGQKKKVDKIIALWLVKVHGAKSLVVYSPEFMNPKKKIKNKCVCVWKEINSSVAKQTSHILLNTRSGSMICSGYGPACIPPKCCCKFFVRFSWLTDSVYFPYSTTNNPYEKSNLYNKYKHVQSRSLKIVSVIDRYAYYTLTRRFGGKKTNYRQ